jgi:hypothetical protein
MNLIVRHTDQNYTPSYQYPGAPSRGPFQRSIDGPDHGLLRLGGEGSNGCETRLFRGRVHWEVLRISILSSLFSLLCFEWYCGPMGSGLLALPLIGVIGVFSSTKLLEPKRRERGFQSMHWSRN